MTDHRFFKTTDERFFHEPFRSGFVHDDPMKLTPCDPSKPMEDDQGCHECAHALLNEDLRVHPRLDVHNPHDSWYGAFLDVWHFNHGGCNLPPDWRWGSDDDPDRASWDNQYGR